MRRSRVGFKWTGRDGGTVDASSRSARVSRHRLRPALLQLEERELLATFTVTNSYDSGPGSLALRLPRPPLAPRSTLM